LRIGFNRPPYCNAGTNFAARMCNTQFLDYMPQRGLKAVTALVQHDALARAASRKVHDVVDEGRHAIRAFRDGFRDEATALIQRRAP
jgi:hypothetical protein